MFLRKYWARVKRWTKGTRARDDRWQLFIGDELLAELHYLGYEFPWVTCRLERAASFEHFQKYFAFLDAPDDADESNQDIEDLLTEVREKGGYRLVGTPSGEASINPTIHIDGEYATFR